MLGVKRLLWHMVLILKLVVITVLGGLHGVAFYTLGDGCSCVIYLFAFVLAVGGLFRRVEGEVLEGKMDWGTYLMFYGMGLGFSLLMGLFHYY